MKTRLIPQPHSQLPGQNVIEIWYNDRLIGTITGADGPGIRFISKYPLESIEIPNERATPVNIIEVRIK